MKLPLSHNEEMFVKYSVRISRRYKIYGGWVAEDERSKGASSFLATVYMDVGVSREGFKICKD